jgi:ATP-binding cassette subfamily B protein
MPGGYDTPAGERGGKLSGGQRQRIALARAMLRKPDILVLDEATSALDPVTEAVVNETLEGLAVGRTVISVTHRLSTAVTADRIFVLENGRLVEQGSHDRLLALDGVYARLWRKQSGVSVNLEGTHARVDMDWLRELPFLRAVDDAVLSEISELLVMERIPENRVIVHEGDMGDKFYIIVRGRVLATHSVVRGPQDAPVILGDGDYFGEIALLKDVPRTATVRSITHCILLALQRTEFLDLMKKAPGLRQAMESSYLGIVEKVDSDQLREIMHTFDSGG